MSGAAEPQLYLVRHNRLTSVCLKSLGDVSLAGVFAFPLWLEEDHVVWSLDMRT